MMSQIIMKPTSATSGPIGSRTMYWFANNPKNQQQHPGPEHRSHDSCLHPGTHQVAVGRDQIRSDSDQTVDLVAVVPESEEQCAEVRIPRPRPVTDDRTVEHCVDRCEDLGPPAQKDAEGAHHLALVGQHRALAQVSRPCRVSIQLQDQGRDDDTGGQQKEAPGKATHARLPCLRGRRPAVRRYRVPQGVDTPAQRPCAGPQAVGGDATSNRTDRSELQAIGLHKVIRTAASAVGGPIPNFHA